MVGEGKKSGTRIPVLLDADEERNRCAAAGFAAVTVKIAANPRPAAVSVGVQPQPAVTFSSLAALTSSSLRTGDECGAS